MTPDVAAAFFVAQFIEKGELFGRFGSRVIGVVDDQAARGNLVVAQDDPYTGHQEVVPRDFAVAKHPGQRSHGVGPKTGAFKPSPANIKLKEATASQLFKRLNSYSRQHPLYQALKEFGKIPKSDFLLRYPDILDLRQAVEKHLNKGENVNKFARAISFGNNQECLYGDKVEQEIAEGCRRLIKNTIICWNYLYLTQKIAEAESDERRQELIAAVPMARWPAGAALKSDREPILRPIISD